MVKFIAIFSDYLFLCTVEICGDPKWP